MFDHNDDDATRKEDRLSQDYDTILKESALLTTFAGILFGFLLEISINTPTDFSLEDRIILLFSITIAASLFVMPVVYHHWLPSPSREFSLNLRAYIPQDPILKEVY